MSQISVIDTLSIICGHRCGTDATQKDVEKYAKTI